ncbi:MAG: hypothetical protein HYR85_15435 [Planctomycetes bacterium]|nr:hypothetical protein [Planctomycetota bacterium]MBI3846838.1 hypothetical protein [Planctomycetota bacterium]
MNQKAMLGHLSAMAASLGIFTTAAAAAGPTSFVDPATYPSYYKLLVADADLLQDDTIQEEEEEEQPEEERANAERIPAEVYQRLADALTTASETGLTRPGEIQTLPRYALKMGDVRLFPQYRQTVRFDDNIFLTDTVAGRRRAGFTNPEKDARKWDIRFEEKPGIFAEVPFAGGEDTFNVGYEANFVNFMRRHQGFGFIEQFAGANVNLKFNNLRFKTGDRYELRYDPIETQFAGVSSGGQITNQLKRGINTYWYEAALNSDKLELENDFKYEYIDFKGPGFITRADRDELTYSFIGGYYAESDLRFFLEYDYVTRRQREHFIGDSFFNRYSIGVNGKLGDSIQTFSRIGWRHELLETNAPIGDPDGRDGGVDVSSDNSVQLDEYTQLKLEYVRESEFSIQSNWQIVDHGEVGLQYTLYQNLLGKVGYFIEHVDPSRGDTFTSGGFGVGIKYVIEERVDFDMDYAFRYRIANAAGSDYYDHSISAALTFKF